MKSDSFLFKVQFLVGDAHSMSKDEAVFFLYYVTRAKCTKIIKCYLTDGGQTGLSLNTDVSGWRGRSDEPWTVCNQKNDRAGRRLSSHWLVSARKESRLDGCLQRYRLYRSKHFTLLKMFLFVVFFHVKDHKRWTSYIVSWIIIKGDFILLF